MDIKGVINDGFLQRYTDEEHQLSQGTCVKPPFPSKQASSLYFKNVVFLFVLGRAAGWR